MNLRPYQLETIEAARLAFRGGARSICLQLPTGAGKTAIVTGIINNIVNRGKSRAWLVAHRDSLLDQIGAHLDKWGVRFGWIRPGHKERATQVHVVSVQTLSRRLDSVKHSPDIIIIDECHHAESSTYKRIVEKFPNAKIIGVTATPERLDGKGLSRTFERLIMGPSLSWLTARDYLVPVDYYAPPIDGLSKIGVRAGDYSADEIEAFLKARKIYGNAVSHYRKIADKSPALVFCRTVQSCYDVAEEFNREGYKFAPLEGSQAKGYRERIMSDFRAGKLDGLTTCELVTEGFDVPRCETVIMLRPTLSRSLYYQMIGRCMRADVGKVRGVVIDPVGNIAQHTDGDIYSEIVWQFYGRENSKKRTEEERAKIAARFCGQCFACLGNADECPICGAERQKRKAAELEQVDGDLVKIEGGIPLAARTLDERREYRERIDSAMRDGDIDAMLELAKELGYKPLWVYHEMRKVASAGSVDVPLLHRIARAAGFKPGWVHFQVKNLRGA